MVSPRLKLFFFIAAFLLSVFSAKGQICLDDYCFLTTKYSMNISVDLASGYRAFLLGPDIQLGELGKIRRYLESNPNEKIILIVSGPDALLYNQLRDAGLADILYSPDKVDSLMGVLIDPDDRLFVFSEGGEKFLPMEKHLSEYLVSPDTLSEVFTKGEPANYLTQLRLPGSLTISKGMEIIKSLMGRHGRLPNFLETNKPLVYKKYLDSLNKAKKFKAIVLKDGDFLEKVSWKELPNLESTGKIHTTESIISPIKGAYRFSPDVSTYTPVNEDIIKIFYANYRGINEGMMMSLNFDENIVNNARPQDKYLYGFVEYGKDPERGAYSKFNGQSNYIDFGIPSSMDFQEITVSAWIKPDTLNGARSIVGIGEVFSAKVHEGKLRFTTPAIRDHETGFAIANKGKWQHVAYVYQANKDMSFYYNGMLVETQPASNITITSHSLLVGSNLWSEYFKGGIDDLYIWNRVLSEEEILRVYEKDLVKPRPKLSVKSIGISLIGLLGIMLGLLIWNRKRRPPTLTIGSKYQSPTISNDKNLPGIYLFGGFKLINKDGEDLSGQFSPKRKELFVLVLLYTFRKNGINSKQMSEILWEGHSFESAKNNRSTQMKRIRETLSENTGVSIDYNTKNWKIKIEEGVRWDFSDYSHFRNELSKSVDIKSMEANIKGLLSVVNEGVLLPNMQYEWLDPIKGQLSEEIIETLTPLIEKPGRNLDADLKLKISNSIFSLDPLNEKALKFKIKLLVAEGKHTLAKNAFDQFCHSYSHFYGEEYASQFSAFL